MKMNKPEQRRILFSMLRMHFPSELFNFNLFWGVEVGEEGNLYQIPTSCLKKSQNILIHH